MNKPVTSTSVAMNGADDVAGSKPRRRKQERQQRPDDRAPEHDAHEGQADRERDEQPVRPVDVGKRGPERDADEPDAAEDGPERDARRALPGA